jgi:hypothetical protein
MTDVQKVSSGVLIHSQLVDIVEAIRGLRSQFTCRMICRKTEIQNRASSASRREPSHITLLSSIIMLLSIEAYPAEYVPPTGNKLKCPNPALFVSPNTAKEGILISVGRKDGDVVFPDKSVSREHLHLTLVSESDIFAFKLVDKSKFGNFVVMEDNKQSASKNDDDSETGDDDTDNEGEPSQTGYNVLSEVTKRLVKDSSRAYLKKIDAPFLLNELLQMNGRVIVQCGQHGSTIVITRVPLRIIFSRLDKDAKDDLAKTFPSIGAASVDIFDNATTHLVSKDRISNAKSLVAWLRETPMVTTAYFQAILDRKTPSDPMPNVAEYTPTGDQSTYWETKPNPQLWSHLTLLSLVEDDMESLARAAGAKIVPIYKESGKTAIQLMRDSICDGAFFINSTASKLSKQMSELKKMNVPYTIQKLMASCASAQLPLTDVEGKILGTPVDADMTPTASNKSQVTEVGQKRIKPSQPASKKSREHAVESEEEIIVEEPKGRRSVKADTPEEATQGSTQSRSKRRGERDKTQDEGAPPSQRGRVNVEAQPRAKRRGEREETQEDDVPPSQRSRVGSRNSRNQRQGSQVAEPVAPESTSQRSNRGRQKPEENHHASDAEGPSQRSTKRGRADSEEEPNKEDEASQTRAKRFRDIRQEQDDSTGRKKLKDKNQQGWFTVAPSGKKRIAYAVTETEMQDTLAEGQKLLPCAPTETVKGLVVGKRVVPAPQITRQAGVKNFKAFRKNVIIRGKPLTRIHLRSVLPKETELQRVMNDEDRIRQEEQRKADELFADRSGNIRGHFKPKSKRSRMS